jgi:hypothetical protein
LRIGDVLNANGGGLTGVINSLNLSYDEAIWELDTNAKLPRNIDVSLGFQVLHEKPIGLVKVGNSMMFGGITTRVSTQGSDSSMVTSTSTTVQTSEFRAAFGENNDYLEAPVVSSYGTATMLDFPPTAITSPTAQQIAAIQGATNADEF